MQTENAVKFQAHLAEAYADLFVNDADYAMSPNKMTPEDSAARMVEAYPNVHIHGKGFKAACKACGIKNTYIAITLFLSGVGADEFAVRGLHEAVFRIPVLESKMLSITDRVGIVYKRRAKFYVCPVTGINLAVHKHIEVDKSYAYSVTELTTMLRAGRGRTELDAVESALWNMSGMSREKLQGIIAKKLAEQKTD